jgi:hypothetical protein
MTIIVASNVLRLRGGFGVAKGARIAELHAAFVFDLAACYSGVLVRGRECVLMRAV